MVEQFGTLISIEFKRQGIDQKEAAKELDITEANLSRILNNKSFPRRDMFYRLLLMVGKEIKLQDI